MKAIKFFSLSVIASLAMVVSAGETVEKAFTVGANPRLDLRNIAGDIKVVRGSLDEVRVTAWLDDSRIQVEFSQEGNDIMVHTEYPRGNHNNLGEVRYEVAFPESGELRIKTVSGSIRVGQVGGDFRLNSVSGSIEIEEAYGRMHLNVVNGNITMHRVEDADVEASSVSGDIIYKDGALSGGDYRFGTVSGLVIVEHYKDAAYRLKANTTSGSIKTSLSGLEVERSKYGPGEKGRGLYNGGGVYLDINTVMGTISIQSR